MAYNKDISSLSTWHLEMTLDFSLTMAHTCSQKVEGLKSVDWVMFVNARDYFKSSNDF